MSWNTINEAKPSQNFVYYEDGSMTLCRKHYEREYHNMLPHQHDFLSISLLLSGRLMETNPELGQDRLAHTGCLSIKPSHTLHSDIFVEDCTILSLKIHDPAYYNLHLEQWLWLSPNRVIYHLLAIMQASDKVVAVTDLKYYLTQCIQKVQNQANIPEWLVEAKSIVKEQYTEPLQIQVLAQALGKHPVHLARCFKQYYGCDIKTYQKYLRIYGAMAKALVSKQNLTQIAHDNGFADQSHFSREFKKMTDYAPRQTLRLLTKT